MGSSRGNPNVSELKDSIFYRKQRRTISYLKDPKIQEDVYKTDWSATEVINLAINKGNFDLLCFLFGQQGIDTGTVPSPNPWPLASRFARFLVSKSYAETNQFMGQAFSSMCYASQKDDELLARMVTLFVDVAKRELSIIARESPGSPGIASMTPRDYNSFDSARPLLTDTRFKEEERTSLASTRTVYSTRSAGEKHDWPWITSSRELLENKMMLTGIGEDYSAVMYETPLRMADKEQMLHTRSVLLSALGRTSGNAPERISRGETGQASGQGFSQGLEQGKGKGKGKGKFSSLLGRKG